MAVRAGAPKPDISSVDGLRRALLQAKSIAYSAQVSGPLSVERALPAAGHRRPAEIEVHPCRTRARWRSGGARRSRDRLSAGERIAADRRRRLRGPLPAEVQRVTLFSAGVASHAKNPAGARADRVSPNAGCRADAESDTTSSPSPFERPRINQKLRRPSRLPRAPRSIERERSISPNWCGSASSS